MRFRGAIITTAFLATPVVVMAQPMLRGFIRRGRRWPARPTQSGAFQRSDHPRRPGFGTGTVKLNENFGFNSNLAVGYGLGNGFRFEVEGDFMPAVTDVCDAIDGTPFQANGQQRHYSHLGCDGQRTVRPRCRASLDVFPYLGLGAGYQWTNLNQRWR